MRRYKIFISAVHKEIKVEHRAVKEFILGNVLLSEYFGVPIWGRTSQEQISRDGVF